MSDHVIKEMKETDDFSAKEDIYFTYLKALNKKQYNFVYTEYLSMDRQEKHEFIDDIETRGIYIHQTPFFGNTTDEEFRKIFREHPNWCTEYKFIGIEKPMTMGDLYFIRLKHEPGNKSSVRSASTLNVKNLPAKSTLKKDRKILVSSTPIRLGRHFQIAKYKLYICWKLLRAQITK